MTDFCFNIDGKEYEVDLPENPNIFHFVAAINEQTDLRAMIETLWFETETNQQVGSISVFTVDRPLCQIEITISFVDVRSEGI